MKPLGLHKQFEFLRTKLISIIENCPEEIFDKKPLGHNNSIHWIVGHILVSTEDFLFTLHPEKKFLPDFYVSLYKSGTNQENWSGNIPSKRELKEALVKQKDIVLHPFNEIDDQPLEHPFMNFETAHELSYFHCFHEAMHIGQIQSMIRVLSAK